MTQTMTKTKLLIDGPLPYLISCRVRLTEDQKRLLKDAYYKIKNAAEPAPAPVRAGSKVAVQTAYNVQQTVGLSDIVIRDLLTTRETIGLVNILSLQKTLGVEAVTPADVKKACAGYIEYIFSEYG